MDYVVSCNCRPSTRTRKPRAVVVVVDNGCSQDTSKVFDCGPAITCTRLGGSIDSSMENNGKEK